MVKNESLRFVSGLSSNTNERITSCRECGVLNGVDER
jgi:hypothetical protein